MSPCESQAWQHVSESQCWVEGAMFVRIRWHLVYPKWWSLGLMKGPNSKNIVERWREMKEDIQLRPLATMCAGRTPNSSPLQTEMRVGIRTGGRWKERLKKLCTGRY